MRKTHRKTKQNRLMLIKSKTIEIKTNQNDYINQFQIKNLQLFVKVFQSKQRYNSIHDWLFRLQYKWRLTHLTERKKVQRN